MHTSYIFKPPFNWYDTRLQMALDVLMLLKIITGQQDLFFVGPKLQTKNYRLKEAKALRM